jgi:hypothetical protein
MTVANSGTAILAVIDFGVPAAYITHIATGNATSPAGIVRWLARRLGPIGVFASLIALSICRPLGLVPGVSALSLSIVVLAILGTVTAVCLSPYDRALYAQQSFRALDRSFAFGYCLSAIGIIVSAMLPQGVGGWTFVAFVYLAPIAARIGCIRLAPRFDVGTTRFRYRQLPEAADFFKVAILGTLAFAIDPLVALAVNGGRASVDVAIVARLFAPVMLLGVVLSQSAWPTIARRQATGEGDLLLYYRAVSLRTVIPTAVAITAATIMSPFVIRLLTNGTTHATWSLISLTAVWTMLSAWGNLLGQVHAGASDNRWVVSVGTAMVIPNIALSILFGRLIGPAGVVLGSVASYVPFFVASLRRIPRLLAPGTQASIQLESAVS